MKRSGRITSIVAAWCVAGISFAQVAAPVSTTTPAGIVTVNFNTAVLATAEAQRDLSALEKKFSPRQTQLQRLNEEVEALKKQLSAPGATLSESERSTRVQVLNGKDKQLQREAEDYKNDSQAESQQVFQRVAQKVYTSLQEYAQQQGYAVVLDRGTDTAPIVWYAASNVDITEQFVKTYNLKSGVSESTLPNKPAAPAHVQGATPKR